jgi:hypothetical protein
LPTAPIVSLDPEYGLILGGGGALHDYGVGDFPRAHRTVLRGAVSTSGRFLVEYETQLMDLLPGVGAVLHARLSGLDGQRFYGFGNDTRANAPGRFFRVGLYEFRADPAITLSPSPTVRLEVGPVLKYTQTDTRIEDPQDLDDIDIIEASRPYGAGVFGQLGGRVALAVDTRDDWYRPSAGLRLEVRASAYPAALDLQSPFGEVHGQVAAYVSPDLPLDPTVAVRVGGTRVWGGMPFHEAAFLGSASGLRGFTRQRFAGDAAAFGNVEVRVPLGSFRLFNRSADYGVFTLLDVGRVSYQGASPGGWHAGAGAGIWFAPFHPAYTVTLAAVRSGEGTAFHAGAGFAY